MQGAPAIPELEGDARSAVEHRGSHLQIIASAGSGKTEVVSQRVARLIADGEDPRSIVAFTFTERAAAELKERVALRVEGLLGASALDKLGGLYVGTIHAYCFRILQQYTPRYETYDVLDDARLTAFLVREANRIDLSSLAGRGTYDNIARFRRGLDVVDNELLSLAELEDPFRTVLVNFRAAVEKYRLLTYGQQIRLAVDGLESDPGVRAGVFEHLRHLIVDEYQDVNPAQERLVELLATDGVELCVVGDDDQAIYQWRGSDVSNIIDFATRYPGVTTFTLQTNRRSRPGVIRAANAFTPSIAGRLEKEMEEYRPVGKHADAVVKWAAATELEEAGWITDMISRLHDQHGVPYRDMAILVRTSAAYPKLMEQLATFDIPVQPGGRIGLFETPEGRLLGQAVCWLTDLDWRQGRGNPGAPVALDALVDGSQTVFGLGKKSARDLRTSLEVWKTRVTGSNNPANLVREYYELLEVLGVRSWDITDAQQANRLGTLARFSALIVDYENVRRRARPDDEALGEQVGGQDRGHYYYRGLGTFILNYATGGYEGFDGEANFDVDAVDLLTIHRAKGLEWPVVFLPSLTKGRFPSRRTGQVQDWLVPRGAFAAARYEGSDDDERRLFYVGATRARDWLSVSRHVAVNTKASGSSPYFDELAAPDLDPAQVPLHVDVEPAPRPGPGHIEVTYSELASFLECGMAYRLRSRIGFQPEIAQELGYGKAVHHLLRGVAEQARAGTIPDADEVEHLLDSDFFLALANKPAHRQMKDAARRLVSSYIDQHPDDLLRVWQTEYPFELRLDGITVSGRADVILDEEGGRLRSLALLDYKTSTGGDPSAYDLQLQVYADAGRRAGEDVSAAYVHDLKLGATGEAPPRRTVDVSDAAITAAETTVAEAGERLRAGDFTARPGKKRCARCDVRAVCSKSAVR